MFTGTALQLAAGVVGWLLLATECAFVFKYLQAARSLAIVMRAELIVRRASADGTPIPQLTAAGVRGGSRGSINANRGSYEARSSCAARISPDGGRRSSRGLGPALQPVVDTSTSAAPWALVTVGGGASRRRSNESFWMGRCVPASETVRATCTWLLTMAHGRLTRFGSKHKSRQRLTRRLNFLMRRFDNRAWYWQFVVWTRQVLLTLVVVLPELFWKIALRSAATSGSEGTANAGRGSNNVTGLASGFGNDGSVGGIPLGFSLLQAALAFCIFATFLVFHCVRMPYPYAFQNRLDSCLFVADMLIIALASLYTIAKQLSRSHELSFSIEVALLVTIVGSLIGTLLYLLLRTLRHRRQAKAAVNRQWLEADDLSHTAARDLDLDWWDDMKPAEAVDDYGQRTVRTRRNSCAASSSLRSAHLGALGSSWSRAHQLRVPMASWSRARARATTTPISYSTSAVSPPARGLPTTRRAPPARAVPPPLPERVEGGCFATSTHRMSMGISVGMPTLTAATSTASATTHTARTSIAAAGGANRTSTRLPPRLSGLRNGRNGRLQEFLAGCDEPQLEGEFSPSRRLPVDEPPPPRAVQQRRSLPPPATTTGLELVGYVGASGLSPPQMNAGQPGSGRRMSAFI